jgi:two-component system, LytTR family, sensor kinase
MSKKQLIYIHIFIWLFAALANLPFSGGIAGMGPRQIVSYIIAFLYLMVVFYLFYLFIVPLFLERKKLFPFLITSFFVVLIMPFIGYTMLFLSRALFDVTFNNFFRGYSFKMHMSGFFPLATAAVFGSFFRVIINLFDTMNQKAEIDRQKLVVELDLIKSKLNPHFLFNTLNNIDALIQTDTDKASNALIKLSEMMRYLTYETKTDFVTLEREVNYLTNMTELYRLRLKNPESIKFEFHGKSDVLIAPALFVPLIENALKFAAFSAGIPAVTISITSENGFVTLDVSNYFDKTANDKSGENSGFGISNLRRRLELTYPKDNDLKIEKADNQFIVKLIINTNGNQMHGN